MAATLRVCLLGEFSARSGDRAIDGLDAGKALELFCYLLLYRQHAHPRETLASLLWGECSTAQSKSYLRKALWQLQMALGHPDGREAVAVLVAEADTVQINRQADIWLDVLAVQEAFDRVHGLPGQDLTAEQAELLRDSAGLYRGDLLPGWYHEWILLERERLRHMHLSILDKLLQYCEAHGEYENGIAYGTRILQFDRARERTHRQLMRLYYLLGDRTFALRQFQRCTVALEEELQVSPARSTRALYDQIRADRLDDTPNSLLPVTAPVSLPASLPASLPGLLARLEELREGLAGAQRDLEREIEAVRHLLAGGDSHL